MSNLYKVLVDGKACHGGTLAWSLPTPDGAGGFTPGQWHAVSGPIEVCRSGLHLTIDPHRWLQVGGAVYQAEGRGEAQTEDDKTAFAEARLLRPAPEMVPVWWSGVTAFVREEIPAVPWFQPDGDPDPAWRLVTAQTWAAAWAAAGAAARDAAGAAAGAAAWAAAGAAAWAAAGDAAGAAERAWQVNRLRQYLNGEVTR
jgi:hypothetical protein